MATFCLLHGAWHDPECWEQVAGLLRALDHEVSVPPLPLHDPRTTFGDRVRRVLDAVDATAGPLVVVGHSMGARYAAAVADGRPGSVVIHLCSAFAPLRDGFPFPPKGTEGTFVWATEDAIATMYPRLEAGTARELAARLRPMAPPADGHPAVVAPTVPTAFVCADDDEFFAPDAEEAFAREALGVTPVRIPGGHFPMAEDPAALAALLDRLAGELLAP